MKIGDSYGTFNRKRFGHLIVWLDTFHGNLVFLDVVDKDVFMINQKDFDYLSKLTKETPSGKLENILSYYKNIGEDGVNLLLKYIENKVDKDTPYDNLL